MTVIGEEILNDEDVRLFIEEAEQAGSVALADVTDLIEARGIDAIETDALYREFEQRGIEVVEKLPEPRPQPVSLSYETTTDALQLFLREAGRHALLTAAQEVELRQEGRAGGHAGEAADDPVLPAARRRRSPRTTATRASRSST